MLQLLKHFIWNFFLSESIKKKVFEGTVYSLREFSTQPKDEKALVSRSFFDNDTAILIVENERGKETKIITPFFY